MTLRTVVALVFLAALLPVAASATTIDQILANPSAVDGKHVEVSGKVSDLREKTSRRGNSYVTFSLCSERCVHVFAFGSPAIADGQSITVRGMFTSVKHVGSYTFYNEIDADDGSL